MNDFNEFVAGNVEQLLRSKCAIGYSFTGGPQSGSSSETASGGGTVTTSSNTRAAASGTGTSSSN